MSGGPNPEPLRRMLDRCGTRPLRRLCLMMAQLGPVPTLAELRAMVGKQKRLASLRGHERRRRRDDWRKA